MDNEKVKALIHTIGLNNNLQDHIVNHIVNSPYKFTRKTITELELPDEITEEEYANMKTNFIYRGIGKLYTDYKFYKQLKTQKEFLTQYHKNKQAKDE